MKSESLHTQEHSHNVFSLPPGFSVLIAEDNLINQKVISKSLNKMGVQADFAENGREVLTYVNKNPNCLIFMDVQMPLLDGIEATKMIRMHHKERPYIVAITSNTFSKEKNKCLESGMNDFISKPFTFDDLRQILLKYIPKS